MLVRADAKIAAPTVGVELGTRNNSLGAWLRVDVGYPPLVGQHRKETLNFLESYIARVRQAMPFH